MPIDIKRPPRARRSAGLLLGLGAAVLVVAGLFLVIRVGDWAVVSKPTFRLPDKPVWKVSVDPGLGWPDPYYRGKDPEFAVNATITTSSANLISPTTPTPYAAINPEGDPKAWRVVHLKVMAPIGFAIPVDLPRFVLPVLSPDARFLAFKVPTTRTPTVEIRKRGDDETVRIEVDSDPGMAVALIDFAVNVPGVGRRIVIGKARTNVYEDIPGEWDERRPTDRPSPWTYQVWNLSGPSKLFEFSAPPFHATRAGFSPGRNYMVMQQFDEDEGHRLVFYDLRTGKQAGSLPIQDADNPRGHPAGLAFSEDGKQLALLWRLNERTNRWGRLMCWKVATGKKIFEHDIGYLVAPMDLLWTHGGTRSIQWLHDNKGWLLFGHLVIRREDGAVIRKIGPEPANAAEIVERIFLAPNLVTDFDSKARKLSLRTLK